MKRRIRSGCCEKGNRIGEMGFLWTFRVCFMEWMVKIKRQKNCQDWFSHMDMKVGQKLKWNEPKKNTIKKSLINK